jgi:DNA-binding beta-propeller fold protein YncE
VIRAVLGGAAIACVCGPAAPASPPPEQVLYALLADGRAVRATPDLQRGAVFRVGVSKNSFSTGRFLAVAPGGRTRYALAPGSDSIAVVAAGSARVSRRISLPSGRDYRALVVGPRSGRLYVAYNVPGRRRSEVGDRERSAHVAALDPPSGRILAEARMRPREGRSWFVLGAAISPDESRLYVTYHGSGTTGLDWLDLGDDGWARCTRIGEFKVAACMGLPHGHVLALSDEVLAATGHPSVIAVDREGAVVRRIDTGLAGNHLMDFALDPSGTRLYAVGSCGYVPGFAALDLSSGSRLAHSRARAVCGERITAVSATRVVVGKTALPQPDAEKRGSLLLVDGRSVRIVRTLRTPAEAVDLLLVGP